MERTQVVFEATNAAGKLNCRGCFKMTWKGMKREHEVLAIVYNKDIWMTRSYRLKVLAVLCVTEMWVQVRCHRVVQVMSLWVMGLPGYGVLAEIQ